MQLCTGRVQTSWTQSRGARASSGPAWEVEHSPRSPMGQEQIISQGGAGKGSFQREKNEGHWARAREGLAIVL